MLQDGSNQYELIVHQSEARKGRMTDGIQGWEDKSVIYNFFKTFSKKKFFSCQTRELWEMKLTFLQKMLITRMTNFKQRLLEKCIATMRERVNINTMLDINHFQKRQT